MFAPCSLRASNTLITNIDTSLHRNTLPALAATNYRSSNRGQKRGRRGGDYSRRDNDRDIYSSEDTRYSDRSSNRNREKGNNRHNGKDGSLNKGRQDRGRNIRYNQQWEEPSRDDYYDPYYDEDDNDEYTSYQSTQADEASTTSSHFFSKKSLTDSTLYQSKKKKKNKMSQREEGTMNSIASIFMELCEAANISRPSRIQALAWPELLQGQTAIIADQTGK